jgi:tRNA pseudouridine65 synthase
MTLEAPLDEAFASLLARFEWALPRNAEASGD